MEELEKALQQLDVSRLRFEDQREARDLARELHRQEQQIRDEVGVELERIRRKVDRSTL